MKRYDARIEDDTLYIEMGADDLEIGDMDDICDIVGGDTFTLQYDDREQIVGWLQTDPDGSVTFDVREALGDMDFSKEDVSKFSDEPLDKTSGGYPKRTKVFGEMMRDIWESKGQIDIHDGGGWGIVRVLLLLIVLVGVGAGALYVVDPQLLESLVETGTDALAGYV